MKKLSPAVATAASSLIAAQMVADLLGGTPTTSSLPKAEPKAKKAPKAAPVAVAAPVAAKPVKAPKAAKPAPVAPVVVVPVKAPKVAKPVKAAPVAVAEVDEVTLTANEVAVLKATFNSDFADPETSAVPSFVIANDVSSVIVSKGTHGFNPVPGVIANLNKKGMITTFKKKGMTMVLLSAIGQEYAAAAQ